jgi:hypothetical protein
MKKDELKGKRGGSEVAFTSMKGVRFQYVERISERRERDCERSIDAERRGGRNVRGEVASTAIIVPTIEMVCTTDSRLLRLRRLAQVNQVFKLLT